MIDDYLKITQILLEGHPDEAEWLEITKLLLTDKDAFLEQYDYDPAQVESWFECEYFDGFAHCLNAFLFDAGCLTRFDWKMDTGRKALLVAVSPVSGDEIVGWDDLSDNEYDYDLTEDFLNAAAPVLNASGLELVFVNTGGDGYPMVVIHSSRRAELEQALKRVESWIKIWRA